MASAPRMVVVAGPSGSGKSTHFPVSEVGIAHFNVDDRCAELNAGSYQRIETTLRTDVAIRQAIAAKAAGFRLEMIFVATDDVGENVARVARRALDGGHAAPEMMLREIYESSLANLPFAIGVFDEVLLYDASAFDEPPRLVARFVAGALLSRSPVLPRWCSAVLE